MCYYNGIKLKQIQKIKLKNFEKSITDYPFLTIDLFNGFDYGHAPVLKKREDEVDFDVVEMEWGFLPPYLKTREEVNRFRFGYKKENGQFQQPLITLNSTSEEMLLPNKIFRDSALNRRCLILSTGFYEWRHIFPIGKKTGKPLKTAVKFPYHVGVKNKDYFFMAGIWQPWKDVETGEYVETFSIITTAANSLMAQIHNSRKRMPAILSEENAWEWLFGNLTEEQIRSIGMQQFPASEMKVCTVAKDFRNSPEPDTPFEYKELPEINFMP
jgi:putative SOS response-associated peptidase YedK